ncbi:MAG TPA: RidA family protein [Candidatus Limnocylindria bacterium]|nr:RidA family protein [Candidatus Limnocylindria bacterium]
MSKVVIKVPDGPPDHPFLSPAVRAGDLVFVSGHAGLLPNRPPSGEGTTWLPGELIPGGIEAETRQALESIKGALAAAGATLADVVKVNTFLRDVDRDFLAYNRVYQEYFPTEPPARTSVGGKIYGIYLVEIECIAYAPLPKGAAE